MDSTWNLLCTIILSRYFQRPPISEGIDHPKQAELRKAPSPIMNIPAFLYFFNLLWASPSVVLSRGVDRHNVAQFKVNSLPGISSLPSSWAGRLPVPGAKKGNEIFFWLFESEKPAYDDNLISKFHGGYWRNSLLT